MFTKPDSTFFLRAGALIALAYGIAGCGPRQAATSNEGPEVKTTFQTAQGWRPTMDNRADGVMIYGVTGNPSDNGRAGNTFEDRVKSWRDHVKFIEDCFIIVGEVISKYRQARLAARQQHAVVVVEFHFIDEGVPFNPLSAPKADTSLPVEERKVGGLGILLATELMDNVSYKRENNQNIVILCKSTISKPMVN